VGLSNGNADVFRTAAGPYFKTSLSAREFGVAKPDVRIFHAAAAQLGVPVEAVLHLGDDAHTDVLGALNAGMQTAWINTQDHDWPHETTAQPFTVPSGITALQIDAVGARGSVSSASVGGRGGRVQGGLAVTPGQILQVNVGCSTGTTVAGFNGGATAYSTGGSGGGRKTSSGGVDFVFPQRG
jgi:hypothetical protein